MAVVFSQSFSSIILKSITVSTKILSNNDKKGSCDTEDFEI